MAKEVGYLFVPFKKCGISESLECEWSGALVLTWYDDFFPNSILMLYHLHENTERQYCSGIARDAKLFSNMESSWLSQLPNLHKATFYFPNGQHVKLILTKTVKARKHFL